MGDFGRGFARIRETLGEDLQGFTRLWEMICKDFVRLCKERDFGEDLQGVRIHETLGEDSR